MATRSSVAPLTVTVTAALFACTAFAAQTKVASEKNPTPTSSAVDADNTSINKRDRNEATTLPTDQPNNAEDLKVAADVRAAIVNDDRLSMKAHNIKLVASSGIVVLRGPVESAEEKASVARIAAAVSGVSKVENRLEISAP